MFSRICENISIIFLIKFFRTLSFCVYNFFGTGLRIYIILFFNYTIKNFSRTEFMGGFFSFKTEKFIKTPGKVNQESPFSQYSSTLFCHNILK